MLLGHKAASSATFTNERKVLRFYSVFSNLALMVFFYRNMNELNTKLMGKGTFAHGMHSVVKA